MAQEFGFPEEIVWHPTPEYIRDSRLKKFMTRYGIQTLEELHKRSIEDPEWFWEAAIQDLGTEFYSPYEKVMDLSRGIQWAKFFMGGKLNLVHNCLDKHIQKVPGNPNPALIWEGEEGQTRTLTYGDLFYEVNGMANALKSLGIQQGDTVGIYMPMIPEIAVAFLATAKIGAIVIPLFSGFSAPAIVSRLKDGAAKVLFTTDGFYRRGNLVETKKVADEAALQVPTLKHLLVYKRTHCSIHWKQGRDLDWESLVQHQPKQCPTEITDAQDPFMIIYTSGTTGNPKGALHIHSGFPIKSAQDMAHGFDVKDSDRMFWVTDLGWMMGPWEILGISILGATMFFYDGALDYPTPSRLFEMVDRHKISILGVSPSLIRALMRHGDKVVQEFSLDSLRILGSTGEPWNPEPWFWFFEKVGKRRCPIINYSGGTEISGGILVGNVLTPLKPCAFSGPVPGMAADVVDENGQSVRGQVGELVLRQPWVGMTQGFFQDPKRYLDAYWSRFENIWVHGDFAGVDQDGFWYILGRSDDTIKIAGKRLGPAEVESALVAHTAVIEAAAIGISDPVKGEALVCFAVLNPDIKPSEDIRKELKDQVVSQLGKAMRPKEIKFVKELPKTRNEKIMRRVIRAVYLHQEPGDISALENPQAIDAIKQAL